MRTKVKFLMFGMLVSFAAVGSNVAQADCFPASGTYLVVDHSGQNLVMKVKVDEACENLKFSYGIRKGSGFEYAIVADLEIGKGFKTWQMDEDSFPVKYELILNDRDLKITMIYSQEEGVECTSIATTGYDTYNSGDASFVLNHETTCVGPDGEKKSSGSAKLYNF